MLKLTNLSDIREKNKKKFFLKKIKINKFYF
jgi:hypothetical protein